MLQRRQAFVIRVLLMRSPCDAPTAAEPITTMTSRARNTPSNHGDRRPPRTTRRVGPARTTAATRGSPAPATSSGFGGHARPQRRQSRLLDRRPTRRRAADSSSILVRQLLRQPTDLEVGQVIRCRFSHRSSPRARTRGQHTWDQVGATARRRQPGVQTAGWMATGAKIRWAAERRVGHHHPVAAGVLGPVQPPVHCGQQVLGVGRQQRQARYADRCGQRHRIVDGTDGLATLSATSTATSRDVSATARRTPRRRSGRSDRRNAARRAGVRRPHATPRRRPGGRGCR